MREIRLLENCCGYRYGYSWSLVLGVGIDLVRPKPHLQPYPDSNHIHTQNYTCIILALFALHAFVVLRKRIRYHETIYHYPRL